MGFKKPIDLDNVIRQLHHSYIEIASPYNDGFTSFYVKQDLYRIKFLLDEMLKELPTFSGEEEWLIEQEKTKMWKELKR